MMDDQNKIDELLGFFKALSDENRLKIAGLLACQPSTVENLADALDLSASTVSHHLSKLSRVGLISVRAEGHNSIYSLNTDVLKEMARRLLHEESMSLVPNDSDSNLFEMKVLNPFLDSDGRIKTIPVQEKKYLNLLRHLTLAFEKGIRYSEGEVNEILLRFHEDTALLRRDLVDYGFMRRERGGGSYWLSEKNH